MSVIVGYSVPAAAFELGQVLREGDFTRIELDRLTVVDDTLVRYFWVYETDPAAFQAVLEASDLVDRVEVLDDLDGSFLCRVYSSGDCRGLAEIVNGLDAVILDACGTQEHWRGRLRFHTQTDATAFQRACHAQAVPLTITGVHDLRAPDSQGLFGEIALTSAQREVLSLALERGYFAIPRRTTLVDLAAEIGVSDQALSERLRRAQTTLARAVVNSIPPDPVSSVASE